MSKKQYDNVDIEGVITKAAEKKSLNRKSDNKVVIVQECTIKIDGKLFTVNFWDNKIDMKQFLLKRVLLKKVTKKADNTYSAGFWTEVDDRFTENLPTYPEDDITNDHLDPGVIKIGNLEGKKTGSGFMGVKDVNTPKTYRVMVGLTGQNSHGTYQKLEFETTITGTLEDASKEFDNMNKLAYVKLQGMLE